MGQQGSAQVLSRLLVVDAVFFARSWPTLCQTLREAWVLIDSRRPGQG